MSTPVASTANNYINMASRMASSPEAIEAGHLAQQTARDVQTEVNQGDMSLRVMTLVAGVAMMIVSILGFMGKFLSFRWDSAFLDAIVFSVGLAFVLLESGLIKLGICAATDSVINDNAPFLRSLIGRGVVFVLTGCIELYMRGFLDTLVGCFSIYVGAMYFVSRQRAKTKLDMARKAVMSSDSTSSGLEQVQEQFALADVDGKGALTLPQFRQFADNLGLALDKRESEAAFMHIDKARTGRLSYEVIQTWWSKGQK